MHVYMCLCAHVYVVCEYVHVNVYMSDVCAHEHMCVCACVCVCCFVYMCAVGMCICACEFVCIFYIYMHP